MRPNFNLMKATLTGALGGLLFGFDTVVISGIIDAVVRLYGLNDYGKGWTVAIALIGTVVGSFGAGGVGHKLGGRETLRLTAVLYVVSAVGSALAWSWPSLMVFRFIGGLGIGASSVLGPVYIAELAPAKWRGRLVGAFQFNVVFGILVAYTSNYLIRLLHLGEVDRLPGDARHRRHAPGEVDARGDTPEDEGGHECDKEQAHGPGIERAAHGSEHG